jgi:hypothetical protein
MDKKEVVATAQVFLNILGQDDKFVNQNYPIRLLEHDCHIPGDKELNEEVIGYCSKHNLIEMIGDDHLRIKPIVLDLINEGTDYLNDEDFDAFLKGIVKRA